MAWVRSAKLDLRLPLAFSLLCFASVSMTLGNKWLMTRPALRPHAELIVIVQNSLAVCVTGGLALLGAVRVLREPHCSHAAAREP